MKPLFSSRPRAACAVAYALLCAAPFVHAAATVQAPASIASARVVLSGTVNDPSKAIIPGAQVKLQRANGQVMATGTTDSSGHFQIAAPAAGDYILSITLDGFAPIARTVHVGAASPAPMALTMNVAAVAQSVDVNADEMPLASAENNGDAATVGSADIKTLPVFDADIVATLSAFVDAGAAGEGGATLVVDGVETGSLNISPSAVERISINQDPYSARYRNPGRGQVEIITKSTADRFHGETSFTFRDASLNAKNYFSPTKPPEQRRIYEGYLTGPVKWVKDTAFLFSATRREQDSYSQVDATTVPTVMPAVNVAVPSRSTALTMKVSHQYNGHHSAYVLYRLYDSSTHDPSVGGLTQQSAGYASYQFDQDLTYHDDLEMGADKLNQLNLRFERNLDRTVSDVQAPQIEIPGVAVFGGAQYDVYNTENNPDVQDIFTWTPHSKRKQEVKLGIQVPNLGRRILEDRTNRQGSYVFSSAATYSAGQPLSFSLQQGQSRFETLYAQPSAFVLDQIQLTTKLQFIPGLRYDFQNTISGTKDGFEPHASLAYVLDEKHGMVVRVGGAVYIRRVGVNIGQQVARYSSAAERSLLITTNAAACYPAVNIANCSGVSQPPSLFNLQPGMQSPEQGYFGISMERQITKDATVTVGYNGYRGWHALRSIDVNAPLPPFKTLTRPNANYSQELELNAGGYQKSDDLSVSYRGKLGKAFAGFLQYDYSHADADTEWSTFMPENQYDPNAEWSRTNYDERQRLSFFGTLYPENPVTLGVGFYAHTGQPYTETTGTDDYGTGLTNARPAGVPRNSLTSSGYEDLEVRLGYTHKLGAVKSEDHEVSFSVSSFNVLNAVNFNSYVGVVSSPEFMQPTEASAPRRMQLSASYSF